MDRLHKITAASAIFFNSALLVGALWFLSDYAQGQETIFFKLEGTHAEDTVSQTAEALG